MFFAFSGGAGLGATDPDEERDPPLQPTPVTFPVLEARSGNDWDRSSLPHHQPLFARIVRPTDISRAHVEALNIETHPPCSAEDFLPPSSNGTSYLPTLEPQQPRTPTSYADATKTEPIASKKRKEFEERLIELQVNNDTAYRTISRTLKPGTKGPRLAYMRKFWEGLENMSRYWDCSMDQYYETSVSPTDSVQSPKRQRIDLAKSKERVLTPVSKQIDADLEEFANAMKPWNDDSTSTVDGEDGPKYGEPASGNVHSHLSSIPPTPDSRTRYRGRRSNTGRQMPDQFRADTVRTFIEGTIWPFQCSLMQPRQMPSVQFGKLILPVRQTAAVYRIPRDRTRARQGRLEGPLIALQVRADTDFIGDDGRPLEHKSRLDSMREFGGLLQLAQERRREGKTEVKPGEGRWWTMEPRWGGGPGGEVVTHSVDSDLAQGAQELLAGIKGAKGQEDKSASRRPRRKTPAMLWKELRCGSALWDPKTDYAAIGKEPSSPYDEVYMVSSLNHHISILKLTVHKAYVDALIFGVMPDPTPEDAAWCKPKLQRTQWFDLFDLDQRVEAFRSLWGIMTFLTRDLQAERQARGSDSPMQEWIRDLR